MESLNDKSEQKLFLEKYKYEFEALDEVQDNLSGSYNEKGIEAWWYRPRVELDGKTPVEFWKINPKKVIELSEQLKS